MTSTEIKKIDGMDHIVITLPIDKKTSQSGKSIIIAGTGGFASAGVSYDGKPVSIAVNATVKP